MKYSEFNQTPDHALNVRRALAYCKEHGISSLEFDPGVYDFYPDTASEGVYCTSNHGVNGYKRIAFLLKDFHNFTLDGGGCEFVFHGVMNPMVADSCTDLTLKNFSLFTPQTCCQSGTVTAVGDNWFEVEIAHEQPFFIRRGQLFLGNDDENAFFHPLIYLVEALPDRHHLQREQADYCVRPQDVIRQIDEHTVRFENLDRAMPIVGNVIWLSCSTREAACVLLQDCQNTVIQQYTAYTGIGMGVLAQNCDTILIDGMRTACKPNRALSLNADATHFVQCTGKITVQNCHFSGQLDDALNVHGIYTRVVEKTETSVIMKYMHHQAKGINGFRVGDVIQAVDAESLLTKGEPLTIRAVEILNIDCTLLTLEGDLSKVDVGDDFENLTRSPEVLFQNNRVEYNRARGILLAARGKTVLRNNHFNSAGPAILFESNGNYWFESGGVQDVVIENNVFEDCAYACWGDAAILMVPRAKTEEGRYFHKRVTVQNNTFSNCKKLLFQADNVETVIFRGNTVTPESALPQVEFDHCETIISDFHPSNR